jgi:diacylglycerol kinase family enzyme
VWDDGKVDLVALEPKTRGEVLRVFNSIKAGGSHLGLSLSRQVKVCKIEIEGVSEGLFMVDGQTRRFTGNVIEVTTIPAAMRFFAPLH